MVTINNTVGNLSDSDRNLFKSLFDYNEVRLASSVSEGKSIESNYMRVYGFRYWDEIEIYNLSEKVKEFNSKSEESEMEINAYDDYEVEWDNDRSYPASFRFSIKSKNK